MLGSYAVIITILLVCLIVNVLVETRKNKSLENDLRSIRCEKEIMKTDNDLLKHDIKFQQQKIESLQRDIKSLKQGSSSKSKSVVESDLIAEAINYAVKKSHPDNGGSNEDFIKFRNLQKEYPNMIKKSNPTDDDALTMAMKMMRNQFNYGFTQYSNPWYKF